MIASGAPTQEDFALVAASAVIRGTITDANEGLALVGATLRARDEITESKEKNPAAGRNAGKESGVYA
jgi:hypothetical protein